MNKLIEMWAALSAYQPQADAAGHGESWAKMCSMKTYDAGAAAASDAAAAASYAADAAYAGAVYAAAAAADTAAADAVEKWAQKAIDSINTVLIKPPQHQGELK